MLGASPASVLRGVGLAVVILVAAPFAASAQPYDVPPTWGGDLWSRPRLTGDWFGFRDEMGKRGVVVDIDFLQILQGNATGGRDTGVAYGGTAEYTLNVDTGKLKLWPGGFFKVYAMSGFGDGDERRRRRDRPGEHGDPLARAQHVDRPHESHVHAVLRHLDRRVRRKAVHARSRRQRLRAQLPDTVPEHGAEHQHGRRPGARLRVGRRDRARPLEGRADDGQRGGSERDPAPATTSARRSTMACWSGPRVA